MRIGPFLPDRGRFLVRKTWEKLAKKHKENKMCAKTIELYVQKCDNDSRFAPVKRSKRTKAVVDQTPLLSSETTLYMHPEEHMMKKICVLLVLMIAALVLMLSTASAAERKVTFTFDKPSYKLGDEITVNYKFEGDGPTWSTTYNYYTRVNGLWKMSDVFRRLEKEGTIKYTPTEGDMTYVVIDFGTPMGSNVPETYKSEEIPIINPVNIVTTFDKEFYYINDTMTINYEITGKTEYCEKITYSKIITSNGYEYFYGGETLNIGEKTGTIQVSSDYAGTVKAQFEILYKNGTSDVKYSEAIPVTEIKVATSFDKAKYNAGDTIKASYEISGIMNESVSRYTCYARIQGSWKSVGSGLITNKSGTITYTPTDCDMTYIEFSINGGDAVLKSQQITINNPVKVTVSFDKESYVLGEEITATYRFTGGNGEYAGTSYLVLRKDGNVIKSEQISLDYANKGGVVKYRPKAGDTFELSMYIRDSVSSSIHAVATVPLTGNAIVDPISVETTFDRTQYESGIQDCIHYVVTGGSDTQINGEYACYVVKEDGTLDTVKTGKMNTDGKGAIYFTPTDGIQFYFEYTIHEYDGKTYVIQSKKTNLFLHISTIFNKDCYKLGQKGKISYKVTGTTTKTIDRIHYAIYCDVESNTMEIIQDYLDPSKKAGDILFVPNAGTKMHVWYDVYFTDGTREAYLSSVVPLQGTPHMDPERWNLKYANPVYQTNSEVAFYYEFRGSNKWMNEAKYTCYSIINGVRKVEKEGSFDLSSSLHGSIRFRPSGAGEAYVELDLCLYDGTHQTVKSQSVWVIEPIVIKTEFNKNSYQVGDEITATWEIMNQNYTSFAKIEYYCSITVDDDYTSMILSSGTLDTSKGNGRVQFTPTNGIEACMVYSVYYSDTICFNQVSQAVKLTGAPQKKYPVSVYVDLGAGPTHELGKEMEIKYSIFDPATENGGSGKYTSGEYTCFIVDHNASIKKAASGKLNQVPGNGTIKYTPTEGERMFVRITLHDIDGGTHVEDSIILDLIDSDAPSTPFIPTNTTKPSNTTKPTDTAKPANPSNTTKPTNTSKPANPSNTTKPTNTPKPANPSNTAKPTNTPKPANPSNTTKPTNTPKPANPSNTSNPTNTQKPANPSNTTKPTDTQKPANPSNTTKPTNTAKPANPSNTAKPSTPAEPKDKVEAYVFRCYKVILGRLPDAGGLKTWYNELTSGRKTASEIIDRFVNSPEYLNKHYNNGESVDILYHAMLGRNADAGGKANWVKKLENGQTLAHVINGFCFSKEFRSLCDSYGIKAGFVNIPITDTTAEGKIKAFVQRCYRIILDREADPSGMQTWYEQLSSGKKAAAEIIDRFVNSPEFSGKNYSHSDSVEILYKAMLGRGSDAAGKANWVGKLDAGQPFAVVINGFCVSKEFTGICASYGIKPGSVTITPLSGVAEEEALSMLAYKAKEPITKKSETNPTRVEIINPSDTIDLNIGTAVQAVYINEEKAKEFISRCYQCILGREASAAELDNWIGQMTNGTKTPDQIARGFLFSNEFKGKNLDNETMVKILYKVYMNRDADPEGLKTWTEKLDEGTSLQALMDTFAKTNEFKAIVKKMGE